MLRRRQDQGMPLVGADGGRHLSNVRPRLPRPGREYGYFCSGFRRIPNKYT